MKIYMQVLYNSLSNLHPYCRARICVSIEILIGNVGTGCLVSSGNLLPYITANWLLLHMVPQHSCWWDQGSDQSGSLCQAARAPGPWQGSLPAVQPPCAPPAADSHVPLVEMLPLQIPRGSGGQTWQQRCTEEWHPSQWWYQMSKK